MAEADVLSRQQLFIVKGSDKQGVPTPYSPKPFSLLSAFLSASCVASRQAVSSRHRLAGQLKIGKATASIVRCQPMFRAIAKDVSGKPECHWLHSEESCLLVCACSVTGWQSQAGFAVHCPHTQETMPNQMLAQTGLCLNLCLLRNRLEEPRRLCWTLSL